MKKSGFTCEKCEFGFAADDELKVHGKLVHKKIGFNCGQCGFKVATEDGLKICVGLIHV